jgi:CHAT domain-containing protein
VDLLTLSACNTAVEGGEGSEVDGLARLAEERGAAAVLATLWAISDVSTPVFMRRFYALREELLPAGHRRTKAEALEEAQRQMARGELTAESPQAVSIEERGAVPVEHRLGALPGWTHPYYWAPFVLLGNGR